MGGMKLVCHGGKCCGIKTIHTLGYKYDREKLEPAIEKNTISNNDDAYGHEVKSDKSFFTDAAPEETKIQRLDRLIAFVKKRRPQHIVEITLADAKGDDMYSQEYWFPILKERGFKMVTSAKNSNSGNTVYVYHLVINE